MFIIKQTFKKITDAATGKQISVGVKAYRNFEEAKHRLRFLNRLNSDVVATLQKVS